MSQPPVTSDETMDELTHRARAISQEAGTKVTGAMREMISAAAGIAGFAVESARDLVQYMVRRGQMTQDEADKLIREAEAVHNKKPKAERDRIAATKLAAEKAAADKKAARTAAENALPANKPLSKTVKTPPPRPRGEEPAMAEKPAVKAAPPAKATATTKAAPAKATATTKPAPAKAAAPAAKATAPAKSAAPAKAEKSPAKKAAAKAPAAKKAAAKKKK